MNNLFTYYHPETGFFGNIQAEIDRHPVINAIRERINAVENTPGFLAMNEEAVLKASEMIVDALLIPKMMYRVIIRDILKK